MVVHKAQLRKIILFPLTIVAKTLFLSRALFDRREFARQKRFGGGKYFFNKNTLVEDLVGENFSLTD